MSSLASYFSSRGFIPHGYCLLWRPDVLALHVSADAIIALSYFSIPLAILWFVQRRADLISEHKRIAILFSVFILGCGMTHLLGIVVLWRPVYVIDGWVKAATALVSVITAAALWPLLPRLLVIPSISQMEAEIAARRKALTELELVREGLEEEVLRRTDEVRALARRFEIATAGSPITLSEQDEALRYTWVHNAIRPAEEIVGRTDEEIWDAAAAATMTPLKREVLRTSQSTQSEVTVAIDGAERHFSLKITPADLAGAGQGLLVAAVEITDQKNEQKHLQLLMRELAHRAKNLLSLVEGVARLTARAEAAPEGFIRRFASRLAALGGAYDLLITQDWRGVDLGQLVASQLAFVLPEARERVTIEGPGFVVTPEVGQYLALALHELATNATKYGVLSEAGGRLDIVWRTTPLEAGRTRADFSWTERGGPAASVGESGFGRLLLTSVVPRALGGEASLEFGDLGACWRASFVQ